MKYNLLVALFIFLFHVVNAQQKNKTELGAFRDFIKGRVAEVIHSTKSLARYEKQIKDDHFVLIPYCRFKVGKQMDCKDILDSIYIPRDSFKVAYYTNFVNDSLIVNPYFTGGRYLIVPEISTSGDIEKDRIFLMYKKARKISNNPFVLSIFPGYAVSSSIVLACIDGKKLRILSYKGVDQHGNILIKYYNRFQDYINNRFGSFKVYLEKLDLIYQSMSEDMID